MRSGLIFALVLGILGFTAIIVELNVGPNIYTILAETVAIVLATPALVGQFGYRKGVTVSGLLIIPAIIADWFYNVSQGFGHITPFVLMLYGVAWLGGVLACRE